MLIEQGERIDANNRLEEIQLRQLPNQKVPVQRRVIRKYEEKVYGKKVVNPATIEKDSQRLISLLGIKQV